MTVDRVKHVYVMLAAYNGESVICRQIESVLNQRGVRVTLLVRDDRSSDSTQKICQDFASEHDNIIFDKNLENRGVNNTFFDLINDVEVEQGAYYAFCDQDDYWLPDKLTKAIELIESTPGGGPCIYCSGVRNVGVGGEFISFDYKNYLAASKRVGTCFLTNFATGCTEVFNEGLLILLKQHKPKFDGYLYDEWVFAVGSSCGRYCCDLANSYLDRTISGRNLEGRDLSGVQRLRRSLSHGFARAGVKSAEARELLAAYGEAMHAEYRSFLEMVVGSKCSFITRARLALSDTFSQPSVLRSIYQRYKILSNRI